MYVTTLHCWAVCDVLLASVEMDGVDSVSKPIRFSKPYRFTKNRHHIKHKFYNRAIPSGFIHRWISSPPSEGCPPDGVVSHSSVADAVWRSGLCTPNSAPLFSPSRRGIGMGLIEMPHSFQRTEILIKIVKVSTFKILNTLNFTTFVVKKLHC